MIDGSGFSNLNKMAVMCVSNPLFFMIAFNVITQTIEIYRMNCRKDVLFKLSAVNSKLEAVLISTATQKNLHLCARMCLSKNTCKSFNYNAITKSCEILSQNKQEAGAEKLKVASGWKYYQPLIYEVRNYFIQSFHLQKSSEYEEKCLTKNYGRKFCKMMRNS